jgi:RecA/RadA recombinase
LVLDFERSWLRERLESWGLLSDKVDILCVGSLEEGYDAVVAGLDIYDLIVIDSVNAIVAQAELGKSVEERVYAPGVREINALLRRMLPALGGLNSNAPAVIFTSQVREEIGSYGGGRAILGGHMLKHIAHVWIETTKADPLKVDVETPAGKVERVVGLSIRLFSQKNKFAPPFRRAQLRLLIRDYKTVKAPAFDPYFDTFSWGLLTGIIEQSGSYYIVKPLGLKLHGKEGIYSLDAEKFVAVREAVSKEVQRLMKEW